LGHRIAKDIVHGNSPSFARAHCIFLHAECTLNNCNNQQRRMTNKQS